MLFECARTLFIIIAMLIIAIEIEFGVRWVTIPVLHRIVCMNNTILIYNSQQTRFLSIFYTEIDVQTSRYDDRASHNTVFCD